MKENMGLLKENLDAQKLRGGYYTPPEIAEFISSWAIQKRSKKILEPSCGDGNFIEAAVNRLKDLGISNQEIATRIKGVELLETEVEKSRERLRRFGVDSDIIIKSDFFHYINSNGVDQYDVVLGNPPFIRYQNFPEEHRTLAIQMMENLGLRPNKLTNIWVPFLVISASLLSEKGRLGMVIPAELFQVKYAAETRVFLSKFFSRITIITFKKLVFEGIQQEIVLLLCEKEVNSAHGIRAIELDRLEDLNSIEFSKVNNTKVKSIEHSSEKWTKYFLNQEEIDLLRRLKGDSRVIRCGDFLDVDVGIVTGRNEFFMMPKSKVTEWKLSKFTQPVVSKSQQLKGLTFDTDDFDVNSKADYPVHLFIPPNQEFETLSKKCREYIKFGESKRFHTGYKCRIRKRWYITPSLWVPGGFALRHVADYPKIILNDTEASSTDTIHRVRFHNGIDRKMAAVSFLNSMTFAFSEITGRSYGGGVLTFVPTEIEDISIPKLTQLNVDFVLIDELLRQRQIDQVLDIIDQVFLVDFHGFEKKQVKTLRKIWRKLSQRRSTRNKSK